MISRIYIALLFAVILFTTISCSKWDNYIDGQNKNSSIDLLKAVSADPNLSAFKDLLVKTHYSDTITSSKNYTVLAPDNEAIAKLDAATLQDSVLLKAFVANHILPQAYLTSAVKDSLYIKSLSGKYVTFKVSQAGGQAIKSADNYYANGVLHTIKGVIKPQLNAWEFLMSTNTIQKAVLQSFSYPFLDRAKATPIGVDPVTGVSRYKPGTGVVTINRFLQHSNVRSEDSLFTYIILNDQAFNAERAKLSKYFNAVVKEVTDSITDFNIVKSLSFKGVYYADALPDTLFSAVDSVKIHLSKSKIVESHRVSNGIVHIVSGIDYKLLSELDDSYGKIKNVVIEGEKLDSMLTPKAYTIRTRVANKKIFTDLLLADHEVSNFWVNYRTQVNSAKYNVHWRVYRDYSLTPGTSGDISYFPMKLAVNTPTNILFTVPKPGVVQLTDSVTNKPVFKAASAPVLLGTYTSPTYFYRNVTSAINFFVVGNNTTAKGTNTLLLDYIKLVPVE